ncbi:MAG: hypothetical protein AAFN12_02980 [Cyanobacteria bacterium J06560_2]
MKNLSFPVQNLRLTQGCQTQFWYPDSPEPMLMPNNKQPIFNHTLLKHHVDPTHHQVRALHPD